MQPDQTPQPSQPEPPYQPPQSADQKPAPPQQQQPYYHNPNVSPNGQHQPYQRQEDPGQMFGIAGIILAVMGFSLVGIIVSFIGQKQSKAAGIKNGIATVSLWINVIFTIIATLLIIGFIALTLMAPGFMDEYDETSPRSSQEYNQDLSPTTNEL